MHANLCVCVCVCVSSVREERANLLRVVPAHMDDPRTESSARVVCACTAAPLRVK